jgi:hypothetical protein
MSTELLCALSFVAGWVARNLTHRWALAFMAKRDPEFKKRLNSVRFHMLEKW